MAKEVLLAKVAVPTSMNHARPITILSCLCRLFSRFIFHHTAFIWKRCLPFPISGGLPNRGVKELAFAQKRCIEDAVDEGNEMGGFSLDLIKAYNTFGRYAIIQMMPKSVLHAWVASLDRLVRYFRRCFQHNRSSRRLLDQCSFYDCYILGVLCSHLWSAYHALCLHRQLELDVLSAACAL